MIVRLEENLYVTQKFFIDAYKYCVHFSISDGVRRDTTVIAIVDTWAEVEEVQAGLYSDCDFSDWQDAMSDDSLPWEE